MEVLYTEVDPDKDLFAILDADGSRSVSPLEFRTFFQMENKPVPDALWADEDTNGDGVIGFEEFSGPKGVPAQAAVARPSTATARGSGGGGARPVVSFGSLDSNADGGVSLEELKGYFNYAFSRGVTTQKPPSQEALVLSGILDLFKAHDTDGNEFVTRAEFRDFWNRP